MIMSATFDHILLIVDRKFDYHLTSPDLKTSDRRALRNRRVLFTTKGAPYSVSVYHAGALAPATNVVIADELTCGQASMNRLGLIWIENTGNSTHFDTVIGAEIDLNAEHDRLKCQIKTGGFKHKNFINTGRGPPGQTSSFSVI